MNITLYQSALDVQHKIALCVNEETGELDIDKLHAIEATFINKGVAVVAVIKTTDVNLSGLLAQRKAINEQFDAEIARQEKKAIKLHDYLKEAMKATGTSVIQSDDGLLQATLYLNRDEVIELDEHAVFAEALLNEQRPAPPRTPSRLNIKAAILAGEAINGARIVRKDRLTIK